MVGRGRSDDSSTSFLQSVRSSRVAAVARAATYARDQLGRSAAGAHLALAVAIVVSAALYCQVHALVSDGPRASFLHSALWAACNFLPWALLLRFSRTNGVGFRPDSAIAGAGVAWIVSSILVAVVLGSGSSSISQSLYVRFPLFPAAVLFLRVWHLGVSRLEPASSVKAGPAPPCSPGRIEYARSSGNYVQLIVDGRAVFWRETMQEAERQLASHGFMRIHRSFLVPVHKVVEVFSEEGRLMVALTGGVALPVSRPYRRELLERCPLSRTKK